MSNKKELAKIAKEIKEIKASLRKRAADKALVVADFGNAVDWKKVRSIKEAIQIAKDWDAVLTEQMTEERFENIYRDTIGERSIYFRDGMDFYEWDWEKQKFSPTTEEIMGIWSER